MESQPAPDDRLEGLLNLGPASARMLRAVGIDTPTALQELGAVMAFQIVRHRHPYVSLNLLWALRGALTGRHWTALPADEKDALRAALDEPLDVRPGARRTRD